MRTCHGGNRFQILEDAETAASPKQNLKRKRNKNLGKTCRHVHSGFHGKQSTTVIGLAPSP